MITYSGKAVFPEHDTANYTGEIPAVDDIAWGLAAQIRFGGQTPIRYSVLCHSIVVGALLDRQDAPFGLVHDASEAVMGDCPTTWKPEAFKLLEHEITLPFSRTLGLTWTPINEQYVREADLACLAAEAHVLGHRKAEHYWPRASFGPLEEQALKYTQASVDLDLTREYMFDFNLAVHSYASKLNTALAEFRL